MSPAIKSRSKSSTKSVKEQQQKAASKLLTAPVNGGNSIPGGAYNPMSGTFHSLERASSAPSSAPPPSNGRFQTIDEREEHSGSSNSNPEYDSLSNGSCSGESEDQKEKNSASTKAQQEAIPGSDTDKRDKIRQKNEKKHQRQRERRAVELHERCTGYLMSRKLEVLAQQLVAMGFPSERATTALIMNEGRVEESIAWLLEGGEGEQVDDASIDAGSNLKIDISDEIAKIADMEAEFKCSKQEVERAVVTCEGDLEKAAEVLKGQRQETSVSPAKPGGSGEPAAANGEHKVAMRSQNTIARTQVTATTLAPQQQQRGDERDFNYSNMVLGGAMPLGSKVRNLQALRPQSKVEPSRLQVLPAAEKRWSGGSSTPSAPISYSPSSPSPVGLAPSKVEGRYAVVGSDVKTNPRVGALREPVVVMQRPQTNAKPTLQTSVGFGASPAVTSGWHPSGVSNVETTKVSVGGFGANQLQCVSSITSSFGSDRAQYSMSQHQPFLCSSADTTPVGWGSSMWNAAAGATPASLAVPSSLGLFTGWGSSGSSGSSSPVDWSTSGSMMQCDYASIDWTLDTAPPPRPPKAVRDQDRLYDAWATALSSAEFGRRGINGGVCIAGLHDGGVPVDTFPSAAGSHEWTSPFAGKDLFSLSRRFVTSPSL